MKTQTLTACTTLAGLALGLSSTLASAGEQPTWLSELSLGARESYDSNLYGVSGDGPMDTEDSLVTTVGLKAGLEFAPLLGAGDAIKSLSLGYAPDWAIYHSASDETNINHKVPVAFKGKAGDFDYALDNTFNWIDGETDAPIYTGADARRSAYATGMPRERREQYQDRSKANLKYTFGPVFVRALGQVLAYDLKTEHRDLTGYQNYTDRYDLNGGLDLGWNLRKDLALTLGYRLGHQGQDRYDFAPAGVTSRNDYQRLLLGIEGKPWKWLSLSAAAGPDFREFTASAPAGIVGDDLDPVEFYGELAATLTITQRDSIAIKYKGWQWVSSTGETTYFDSSSEVLFKHAFDLGLTLEAGTKLGTADYNPASARNDWLHTGLVNATYALTKQWSVSAGLQYDLARNHQDNLPDYPATNAAEYREYNRVLGTLGVAWKY